MYTSKQDRSNKSAPFHNFDKGGGATFVNFLSLLLLKGLLLKEKNLLIDEQILFPLRVVSHLTGKQKCKFVSLENLHIQLKH